MMEAKYNSPGDVADSPPESPLKQAEEALQLYQTLFQQSPIPVALSYIENGEFIDVNNAFLQTLGYARNEVVGKTSAQLGLYVDPDQRECIMKELMATGSVSGRESSVRRKDGSILTCSFSARLTESEGKRQVLGLMNDITGLKRAEEKHRIILETALDGFLINDLDGRVLEVNDSYCRMVGYTREELLTMSIPDLEAVERPEKTVQHMKKLTEQGYHRFESRHKSKNGRMIDVGISVNYVDVEGGQVVAFVRDISERKRAEQVLRESEAKYRTLVENIPQKIFLKDKNSVYLSCNNAYAADLEIKPEEISGHTDYDFYPGDLAEKYRADDKRVVESGNTERIEERYIELGQERIVETLKASVRDEGGQVVGVLGVFHDITERKRAEEAREEIERNYRLLAENTGDVVSVFDLDMNLVWVSPSVEKQTGYTVEEMKNVPPDKTMTPESIARAVEAFNRGKQLYEEGKEFADHLEMEGEVYRKDGSTFWSENRYQLVRDSEGKPAYILMQGRDITEPKRAEEALRQSEERFRNMANMLPQTIFEVDERGDITFVNRQGYQTFGYSEEDIVRGINLLQIIDPEDHARAVENLSRRINGEEPPANEYTAVRKDGSRLPVVIYARSMIQDGRYAGMRGILIDMTEHKKAEEALRQSEARYRLITDNTADSIWALGPDLRIAYQSPSGERIFGYTLQEWQTVGWSDFVHPDYLGTVTDLFSDFRHGREEGSRTITVKLRNKDGRELWAETSASPIRGQDGEFAGVVGVTRDVSERMRAEQELLEYKAAVEQSADGIALANMDGHIRFVNEAWASMHGRSVEELMGRHLSVFHTQRQMDTEVIPFNRRLLETGGNRGEVWHVRKNGEEFPTFMTTTVFKGVGDRPFAMLALLRDISGQKELERQRREQEIAQARAEELSESRRRLINAQEALRRDIAGKLHGTVQGRLILLGHRLAELEAKTASETMAGELADIRHRLEELQNEHIGPISHQLFPSILRLGLCVGLEALADEYSAELSVDLQVSKRLRAREQADRRLVPDNVKLSLYRIAQEALANILKHTSAVPNTVVKLSLSDGGILRLTVSDDGAGFDKASPVAGIGLAIISDYAAAAGGSCVIKTIPGKGTRVRAEVPIAGPEAGH